MSHSFQNQNSEQFLKFHLKKKNQPTHTLWTFEMIEDPKGLGLVDLRLGSDEGFAAVLKSVVTPEMILYMSARS